MIAVFIGSSAGMILANFLYQALCFEPNWDAAVERSFFQLMALIGVGAALAIRSINA